MFSPNEKQNYSEFDFRFAEESPLFQQISFANFSPKNQFYWALDGNRVVFETKGFQGGLLYQGQTDEIEITQDFTLRQSFFGAQAMWSFPGGFEPVAGEQEELDEFTVLAIAATTGNPENLFNEEINLNVNIDDLNLNNTENDAGSIFDLGTGSSDRIVGGGSLFDQVDPANAPRMLQAFPTVNLSSLLDGGRVPLAEGATIPASALQEAGITFGSPISDEGGGFDFEFSSDPGIKIAQRDTFDNLDLMSVMVNPFLSEAQRNVSYLNSLLWISLGQRQPEVETQETRENSDWHRFYSSYAHNRTLLEYDPEEIAVTYTNVFISPGASISFSLDKEQIDGGQSANATLGLLLGTPLIFFTEINNLQNSLQEAKQELESGEQVTPLQTRATSEQRRQMNQRLNQTLRTSGISSELIQTSGNVTFPSRVTPSSSNIFQLKTGLYQRSVQLQEQLVSTRQGEPFFSETRLSNEDFNLRFLGVPIAGSGNTDIPSSGIPFAAEVALISPDGQQFGEQFSSETPLPTEGFAIAFDRIGISRIDRRTVEFEQFRGVLNLPSVELLWSGSSQDFNYGFTGGMWYNLSPESVAGMRGLDEPVLGVYLGSFLNATLTRLRQDEQGNTIGIDAHIPSLRVSWNSQINERNPFSATLFYTYVNQRRSRSFTISPLITYIYNGQGEDVTNAEFIGFLRGQLSFNTGLTISSSLEVRDQLFYDLEATQKIGSDLSLGLFISNFNRTLTGLSGRNEEFNFGPIIQFNPENKNALLEGRLKLGGNSFDLRFEGNINF